MFCEQMYGVMDNTTQIDRLKGERSKRGSYTDNFMEVLLVSIV